MSYNPGMICWTELVTTDINAGKKFYATLFNWQVEDSPLPQGGAYSMLNLGDKMVAGAYQMMPEQLQQHIPAHWLTYFATDNVEHTIERATKFGGEVVLDPMEVMEHGRMAMLKDPTGAVFAVWQAKQHIGAHNYGQDIPSGARCWSELVSDDVERAKAFYSELFAFKQTTNDMGGTPYTTFMLGEHMVAGLLPLKKEWGPMPSSWINYFTVADCDQAAAQAVSLGAKQFFEPIDIPDMGRFTWIGDPQGAVLGIFSAPK